MITIAVYNSKGGVGKTTSCVNLAYTAAIQGSRTLLWDLDPQASASFYYKINPKIRGGAKKTFKGKHNLEDAIQSSEFELLDILPADVRNRNMDILLDDMKKSHKHIASLTKQLTDYDLVFIDAPPGLSLLSDNIIHAADYILFPIIPSALAMRTYEQVLDYFKENDLNENKILPFFTLVDTRKAIHKSTVNQYLSSSSFLQSTIPYSSDVEKMGIHLAPLLSFAKNSKAGIAYSNLWEEVQGRIGL